jgi:hypothetical protein
MLKTIFRKSVPHLVALLLFLALTLAYFHPILEGKQVEQPDIIQYRGMAREITEYREKTGEEILWTNSMFAGMPSYLISMQYPFNLVRHADSLLSLGLPRPAKFLFLSLLGFYILLLAFRVNPWLSIAGALAFGLSTYFFIIGAAGHNTKSHAMAYMAPLMAGIFLTFRGKVLLGCVLTGLFLALQIYANHLQITYYTLLIVIVYGIYELVYSFREKLMPLFFKRLAILFIPVVLAIGANFTNLYLVWEYGRFSMRGPSELTGREEVRTGGLDKDYILDDYSYGIAETMNLMIPDFMGGASSYDLGTGSEVYQALNEHGVPGARDIVSGMPAYWGPQRFTAGPVYIGASVVFFFLLALFILRGRYKWWLLTATLLSVMLAWGNHFLFLSELFIYYFPGYNRFRTVSMILVIAQMTIPLLALLGIREVLLSGPSPKLRDPLKKTFYLAGGVTLFFALLPGMFFDFSADIDQQLLAMGWPDFLVDAIQRDRMRLLRSDAFRSFIFVSLSGGLLYLYLLNKMPAKWLVASIAVIFLFDLWPVNRRFLNNDDFASPRELNQPFLMTQADAVILQDDDPHYRVYNTTRSPFNEAITSFHHKSIGGYHGAKMGRYQDLIDHHLRHNNMDVLNMLNTKYFIQPGADGQPQALLNPRALGNAWFVESVRLVDSPDEEIEALNDFTPATEAVADRRFEESLASVDGLRITGAATLNSAHTDPGQSSENNDGVVQERDMEAGRENEQDEYIELVSYHPNRLEYRASAESERLAVFSEVYYDAGWRSYINGEPAGHFRVNYILRAMKVPPGEHEIEFRFKPRGYYTGEWISLFSSLLLLVLSAVVLWREFSEETSGYLEDPVETAPRAGAGKKIY